MLCSEHRVQPSCVPQQYLSVQYQREKDDICLTVMFAQASACRPCIEKPSILLVRMGAPDSYFTTYPEFYVLQVQTASVYLSDYQTVL